MLRVLGKASSINVRKVMWTAEEVGVATTREDWGSGFRPLGDPEFLALNPNALVPVMVDGDLVLWESNTIVRYLAAEYGAHTGLLPATPRARAEVEKWMDWQATELNGAWRYAFQALVRRNPACQNAADLTASVHEWSVKMRLLDRQLAATGAYAAGAELTVADIVLGLSVHRWFMTPIPERPELAAVAHYYERLSARPAFLRHGRNGIP